MTHLAERALPGTRLFKAGLLLLSLAVPLLACGTWLGLLHAPPDRYMGEVQRIMYVHVPTAWVAMLMLTAAFAFALTWLFSRRPLADALHEASVELGVLLSFLLCLQGAIWAKPTWGVYWDWDPRLTTVAVMLFAFIGVLSLRSLVDDPRRRATWSAAATIIAFADLPIVYFSVRWWNSLHQVQSSPETVDAAMLLPLRLNALGLALLAASLLLLRARLGLLRNARALLSGEEEQGEMLGEMQAAGGER